MFWEVILADKKDAPEEPTKRGNVVLTEADWALLGRLGGKRGMSETLREMLRRKRNAENWHRLKAMPDLWASALQAADEDGVNSSEYICGLIAADIKRRDEQT